MWRVLVVPLPHPRVAFTLTQPSECVCCACVLGARPSESERDGAGRRQDSSPAWYHAPAYAISASPASSQKYGRCRSPLVGGNDGAAFLGYVRPSRAAGVLGDVNVRENSGYLRIVSVMVSNSGSCRVLYDCKGCHSGIRASGHPRGSQQGRGRDDE